MNSIQCDKDDIWHFRFGHPSRNIMSIIHKYFPNINIPTDHICDVCYQSKLKRLPFPNSNSCSCKSFDLIHTDIWGPTAVSLDGHKHILTIIDDYSRFTWTIPMKNKGEVTELIP